MSRPLRIEYVGAWFHVMNRGLGHQKIFRTDRDRQLFLRLLGETVEVYKIEIHAYSLMDNHYHLLVQLPQLGLSRAMRHLNGVYTQKVNKNWGSDGPIFRGRYKARLVDSEEYLLELVRYIHLNPVEAGICQKPEADPWTSHIAYLNKGKRPQWLVIEEVLNRFGNSEQEALQELNRYVQEGIPDKLRKELNEAGTILGSKGFSEWVYQNFVDRHKKGVPLQERAPKPSVPFSVILRQIAHLFNLTVSDLRKGGSGTRNEARSLAAYLGRTLGGYPHHEIARWLRASDGNAIAQIQYRFKRRLEENRRLRKLASQMTSSILNNVRP